MCFFGDGRMIALYAKGAPKKNAGTGYNSKLSLIAIDLDAKRHEVLDEQRSLATRIAANIGAASVYVSNTNKDSVTVYRVEDNRLIYDREIEGFDFPHGLDVLPDPDLLAVTNYGNNTIALRSL